MNKHEWAARQQEKPKPRPKDEELEDAAEAEEEAANAPGASKPAVSLTPDN